MGGLPLLRQGEQHDMHMYQPGLAPATSRLFKRIRYPLHHRGCTRNRQVCVEIRCVLGCIYIQGNLYTANQD